MNKRIEWSPRHSKRLQPATQRIESLCAHISWLNQMIHSAYNTSQKERLALDAALRQTQELQSSVRDSRSMQTALQIQLSNERQNHWQCQSKLKEELSRCHKTELELESIWAANTKLHHIISNNKYCNSDKALELSAN